MSEVSLDSIRKNEIVRVYIKKADEHLEVIGYTEHGFRHANIVSKLSHDIIAKLGYPARMAELAAISGFLHDIGNVVGRNGHGPVAALIAQGILEKLGMGPEEVVTVMSALGNHEEEQGDPTNAVSSALIIADKADVHRSRVRNPNMISFDIHDRVNYAATESSLGIDDKAKTITLAITIDTYISQVMEYFEIFLSRMVMCRKAASFLGCEFHLVINGVKLS
jgi:metal-dependent HD superfamily phosphatase/phosphodiesterase